LKKVKQGWSHELKRATTTTKTKVTKVRAKSITIHIADVNTSATLPWWCQWNYKLCFIRTATSAADL